MFPVFTTIFQIARISTIFCVSSCIIYEKNPFFRTYNLQQIACRYSKKCALESLLKKGHGIETPGIIKYQNGNYTTCMYFVYPFSHLHRQPWGCPPLLSCSWSWPMACEDRSLLPVECGVWSVEADVRKTEHK